VKARGRRAERTLFVYGSLLRGLVNHDKLEGARFLREAATEAAFTLVDLGAYPALVREGAASIGGELYAVPARMLPALDAFEGHPRFYRRSAIRLADGSAAEAYLLPPEHAASLPRVEGTSWRETIVARRASGDYANPPAMSPLPIPASGMVVWITGLPSSGKSTLAARLRQRLVERGRPSCVLDGDEVRGAIVPAPGYTPEARDAFYATLARLAALIASQGLVVVVPATAHRAAYRAGAREIAPRFVEVHVDVSADECRRRDAKGLYAATSAGSAQGLPGADLAYELPASPDVVAAGGHDDEAVARVLALIDAPA
jgi:adenylylsulfate kinase